MAHMCHKLTFDVVKHLRWRASSAKDRGPRFRSLPKPRLGFLVCGNMTTCMCVYMYVDPCLCALTDRQMYICIYVYICLHTYIHMHIWHIYIYVYVQNLTA